MPSTVLAVDDSVTMRKVLEITFTGPDFNVVTVDSADAALQKLKSIKADVVVADVTLEPKNGYDLCKAVKAQAPGVPVLVLSSKQNPFDPARGSAVQADDHIDKPFDTQQMIDKVKKLLAGGKAEPVGAAPMARPAANPLAQTIVGTAAPVQPTARPAVAGPSPGGATPGRPQQRAQTLVYNPGVAMPAIPGGPPPAAARPAAPAGRPAEPVRPAAPAVSHTPAARPMAHPAVASPTSPSLHVQALAAQAEGPGAHINGQMAAKLEELGLTPTQVDAVVALSREVVERVVWEVVPVLAETIIKEELARLTK
ncbi:MAG: response regulator [Polyangiaceae bacterium]|nr:response regulator [Polyangiaceae bacterium]